MAEDQRQQQLVYRFLVRVGVNPRQVEFEISPSGRGSAEQWVRNSFARQVKKCRSRHTRAATALLVMIDADTHSLQERTATLEDALIAGNQRPIDAARDPVAILIPKRNVEAWVLCLYLRGASTPPIDEEQDYKRTRSPEEWSEMIHDSAEALVVWTGPEAAFPANLIGSLRHGIGELRRVFPRGR
jgi:hypothetical protein